MCILAFHPSALSTSFSSLISALKDEKARMHIVHPSFFILQLTPHTSHHTPHTSHHTPHTSHLPPHTSRLQPARKRLQPARKRLQPARKKEKLQPARMQFQPVGKNLGDGTQDAHCASWLFFILQLTESAEISELKDEKARMHNVHLGFSSFSAEHILQLTDFSTEG